MCFKNKWQPFTPTQEYLDVVKELTSIKKLHEFLKQIKWQGEEGDYWMTPIEFLKNINNNIDCEDFVRFALDVLVRIIKVVEARWIIFAGYNKEKNGNKKKAHAITVFPYRGKLAIFNNNRFKSGFNDYIEIGHYIYPDGLKYQEIRNSEGKILSKRNQWIGKF